MRGWLETMAPYWHVVQADFCRWPAAFLLAEGPRYLAEPMRTDDEAQAHFA
ncbi:hypothetical protein ACFO5X_00140 [Seohaeicola nanhaiensis]|uniref:Uncharacterized protein n=1 Tax=Seohaeicola nanhaiensis TaxID=1387282 RepID=A0ABV9KBB8_9RHOB